MPPFTTSVCILSVTVDIMACNKQSPQFPSLPPSAIHRALTRPSKKVLLLKTCTGLALWCDGGHTSRPSSTHYHSLIKSLQPFSGGLLAHLPPPSLK